MISASFYCKDAFCPNLLQEYLIILTSRYHPDSQASSNFWEASIALEDIANSAKAGTLRFFNRILGLESASNSACWRNFDS
jgi:hypothetical protein